MAMEFIKQDKRAPETLEIKLPAALADRLAQVCVDKESEPSFIVEQALHATLPPLRKAKTEAAPEEKPKTSKRTAPVEVSN